jgi:hypothetical protein
MLLAMDHALIVNSFKHKGSVKTTFGTVVLQSGDREDLFLDAKVLRLMDRCQLIHASTIDR